MINPVENYYANLFRDTEFHQSSEEDEAIYLYALGVFFVLSLGMFCIDYAKCFWKERQVEIKDDSQVIEIPQVKQLQASASSKSSQIDLKRFGLTVQEYEEIRKYYSENKSKLVELKEPVHIRKDSVQPNLPRSLVYIPKGSRKGLYVLCKKKGGVEQIGIGANNRLTLALHFDTGEEKACRSAKKMDVPKRELVANRELRSIDLNGKHFVTGDIVHYDGPWTPRRIGQEGKELNVEKVLMIMDLIDGECLFDLVNHAPQNRPKTQTQRENIKICLDIVSSVGKLQEAGFINLDNKPENILLNKKKNGAVSDPKIADFGYVYKRPFYLFDSPGSAGYYSPEILELGGGMRYGMPLQPANEIWALGVILSLVTKGHQFYKYTQQNEDDGDIYHIVKRGRVLYELDLKKKFPNFQTENSLDQILHGCLRYRSGDRLPIDQIIKKLRHLYKNTPKNAHPSDPNWFKSGYQYA